MCIYRTQAGFCKKYSTNDVLSYCVEGPCKDEVLTNADRIRAMSDEELARQLVINVDGLAECRLYLSVPTGRMFVLEAEAERVTLDWLRQTAEEG